MGRLDANSLTCWHRVTARADDIVQQVKSARAEESAADLARISRYARRHGTGGDGGRDHLGSGWVQGRDVGDCQQSRHPPTG